MRDSRLETTRLAYAKPSGLAHGVASWLEPETIEPTESDMRNSQVGSLFASSLLTEMGERVAQGSAGDFHNPLEWPVHFQDQKD